MTELWIRSVKFLFISSVEQHLEFKIKVCINFVIMPQMYIFPILCNFYPYLIIFFSSLNVNFSYFTFSLYFFIFKCIFFRFSVLVKYLIIFSLIQHIFCSFL